MSGASTLISAADELRLLVDIINALPPNTGPLDAEDLTTGHRLWDVLRFCAPDDYKQPLPADTSECEKWVARHENLKRVERALSDVLAANGIGGVPGIDLKLLAERRSAARGELARLLRMFTCTTAQMPFVQECVVPVQELPTEAQQLYMNIVSDFPSTAYLDGEEGSEADIVKPLPPTAKGAGVAGSAAVGTATAEAKRDPELYREEVESAKDKQIVLLQSQKAELEDTIRHLENRIERLRKNNQDLDEKIKFVEDSLRKNETQGSQEAHIYSLETKLEAQDRLIEEQEDQLDKYRKELERINAELNQLRKANEDIQPLKDEVDELQHKYEEAARKANMVDKYAQKLEAMKVVERNYRDLQGQYEELRHDMGAGSSASTEIAGLRRTVDEYRRLLPGIETERHELAGMLNQSKDDMRMLEEQLATKRDELTRAEETIVELRNGQGLSVIDASGAGLESEMEDSERKAALEALDPEERANVLAKDLREERAKLMATTSQMEDYKNLYTELQKSNEELRSEKVALERAATKAAELEPVPPTPPPKDDVPDEEEPAEGENAELHAEIMKLKERIKLMETQDPSAKKAADAALMRQELLSLRSETKLMATAWYGLNKRSQLNSAILQKKTEVPQGFLGRARIEVERAIKVRGR